MQKAFPFLQTWATSKTNNNNNKKTKITTTTKQQQKQGGNTQPPLIKDSPSLEARVIRVPKLHSAKLHSAKNYIQLKQTNKNHLFTRREYGAVGMNGLIYHLSVSR